MLIKDIMFIYWNDICESFIYWIFKHLTLVMCLEIIKYFLQHLMIKTMVIIPYVVLKS